MTGMFNKIIPCRCGSDKPRFALHDAAGIFCTYVCDACEDETRKRYNPAIFEGSSAYAVTGDEDMIGYDGT